MSEPETRPLYCPRCQVRHVDLGPWAQGHHHTHLCASCGHLWRIEPYAFGSVPQEGENAAAIAQDLQTLRCGETRDAEEIVKRLWARLEAAERAAIKLAELNNERLSRP